MNRCTKAVVNPNCHYCFAPTIKYGKTQLRQRYRCKNCKRTQISHYLNKAWKPSTDSFIIDHIKEGCGIRSIARLIGISPTTVIQRIKIIASNIKKPPIGTSRVYEMDELKTYIKRKSTECWVCTPLINIPGRLRI